MYGVIYCLTSPSGKVYIGQAVNYAKRMATYSWAGCKDQPYLYSAIVKHGWANFKHEIIAVGYSKAELDQLEIAYISELKAADRDFGYNLSIGGTGGQAGLKRSPAARANMAEAARKRVRHALSATHKANLAAAAKLRAPPSEETRSKLSSAARNRTPEHKAKLGLVHKGAHGPHPAAVIAKMSESQKRRWAEKKQAKEIE